MKPRIVGLLAFGALSLPLAATAATITYNNEAAFVAATGSALLTLPNAAGVSPLTIAGELQLVESANGGFYSGSGMAAYWNLTNNAAAGNYTVKSGIESFDLLPLKTIYAIGFSLYEPTSSALINGCNTTCVNSTFQIELLSGTTSLGSYTISPANNAFNFYGYWTADPITTVTIRETVGANDNEFFGRFMTGTTSNAATPSPVPLPAAGWLLLSGLGALDVFGRRRKKV